MIESDEPKEASLQVPTFSEVLALLAREIRSSRKVSESQLAWFQQHAGNGLTVEQLNKKLEELKFFLTQRLDQVMSTISDFADKVDAWQTDISASVDGVVAALGGVSADVASLKQQIIDLQNSPGAITPEDQARLDKIEAAASALSTKTAAASSALAALDAQTENAPAPTQPT